MERYEDALQNYQKCRELKERILGTRHPDVATIYGNMAHVYTMMDRADQACDLWSRCLEIRTGLFGPKHVLTEEAQEQYQVARSKVNQTALSPPPTIEVDSDDGNDHQKIEDPESEEDDAEEKMSTGGGIPEEDE
eukprot:TRINITY_DN7291_c0_g1_i4.p3 TRINITY_DN7291_c0_g1~~TRINITY_DN7291_c0_g1_i4.p3  ORF type:complete len:135 (-),score=36.68 TRINITY_DN7291_c0_g1_i4:43-447(-)